MTDSPNAPLEGGEGAGASCLTRRSFVLVGAGAATVLLGELFPGRVFSQDIDTAVRFAAYPRRLVGRLSELRVDEPVDFQYPDDGPHSMSMLVKLGRAAGGGVGPDQDIVAFNLLCTHQGGLLRGNYSADHKLAGPCPIHLSTFDLTRHGMLVAGHATAHLPQVMLELEGDEIHAVGVVGLIYGYQDSSAYVREA